MRLERIKSLTLRPTTVYAALFVLCVGAVASAKVIGTRAINASRSRPLRAMPDTARLRLMGLQPGTHLTTYVLVSTNCGYCNEPELHRALGRLRQELRSAYGRRFAGVSVVGVNIDPDVRSGVSFLAGMGAESFDEVSVGQSWANETLGRLVWRERLASASVPQVLIFARPVQSTLRPLSVAMAPDSLLLKLSGRTEVLDWVRRGYPLIR